MKIIYVSFLIGLLHSCTDKGKDVSITYQIVRRINNNSGNDVEIINHYNLLHNNKVENYVIKNGKEYVENGEFLIPENVGGGIPESDIAWTGSIDSVIVIFDKSKFQLHCTDLSLEGCTIYDRSIILGSVSTSVKNRGYELVKVKDNYREYLYTITEEDYENAKPIGG